MRQTLPSTMTNLVREANFSLDYLLVVRNLITRNYINLGLSIRQHRTFMHTRASSRLFEGRQRESLIFMSIVCREVFSPCFLVCCFIYLFIYFFYRIPRAMAIISWLTLVRTWARSLILLFCFYFPFSFPGDDAARSNARITEKPS